MSTTTADSRTRTQLPITPFLDMSFQLLFFFVMMFHPSAAEGQISTHLPRPGASAVQPPTPDLPFDERSEFLVRVHSDRGAIVRLTFGDATGQTNLAGVADLAIRLKGIATRPDAKPSVSVRIEAMPDLQYAQLITVMDTCISAGFDRVGVGLVRK